MIAKVAAPLVVALLILGGCEARKDITSIETGDGTPVLTAPFLARPEIRPGGPGTIRTVPDTVHFAVDRADLDARSRAVLDSQATWLRQNEQRQLIIEGHCDERGTREYNLALGERRAKAVREYLIERGVGSGRIQTISYGKERPMAVGSDEQSWAQNRRAVTVIVTAN